jgi:protein-tyrosine phosphatase
MNQARDHATAVQSAARTSATSPLRIATVAVGKGQIGITLCPGKNGQSILGTPWERDLVLDLGVIRHWGASTLVTLIEEHEFDLLGVSRLGEQARSLGLEWLHLPITDGEPPDARFENGWLVHGPAVRDCLLDGGKILVHCRAGLGRAGTIAARLLVEFGVAPRDAINRVRAARPGAIETPDQERYVLSCRPVVAPPAE